MSEASDRPGWAGPESRPAAFTEDLVSGRKFRLWLDPAGAHVLRKRRFGRDRAALYLLEELETGTLAGRFASLEDAAAWVERMLISTGLNLVEGEAGDASSEAADAGGGAVLELRPGDGAAQRASRLRRGQQ
jgi:hypothetical protein